MELQIGGMKISGLHNCKKNTENKNRGKGDHEWIVMLDICCSSLCHYDSVEAAQILQWVCWVYEVNAWSWSP